VKGTRVADIDLSNSAAGTGSLAITKPRIGGARNFGVARGRGRGGCGDGTAAAGTTTTVAFIDSRVADHQDLIAGLGPNDEWVVIDGGSDGVLQMQAALAGRSGLASIRILAHGRPGALLLGATELTREKLDPLAEELATIGRALDARGEVQIYACEMGKGDAGRAFVEALSEGIGAPVAAASGPLGDADLGGDWRLDVGELRGAPLHRPQWHGLLALTVTPQPPVTPHRSAGESRNDHAFAALRADGSVVTWGDGSRGGNSSTVASQLSMTW
jgi:hypothetical protein